MSSDNSSLLVNSEEYFDATICLECTFSDSTGSNTTLYNMIPIEIGCKISQPFLPSNPTFLEASLQNITSDNQTLERLKFDFGKDLGSFNTTDCKFESLVFSEQMTDN